MSDYLEEAAQAFRQAQSMAKCIGDATVSSERLLRAGEGFTRLAAIERGLLPPEMAAGTEPGQE